MFYTGGEDLRSLSKKREERRIMERGKKRGAALLLAGLMTCSAALLSACGSGEGVGQHEQHE